MLEQAPTTLGSEFSLGISGEMDMSVGVGGLIWNLTAWNLSTLERAPTVFCQVENAMKEQSEAGFVSENSDALVSVFLNSQFDALEAKQELSQFQDS